MAELIVKSKIKEVAKDFNVSGDVAEALNKIAVHLIEVAVKRAEANGRRTVQAKDVYAGKKFARMMIVVRSQVKEIINKYNVSGDFAEALNEMIIWTIEQGCGRAKANGRRTLQARDL